MNVWCVSSETGCRSSGRICRSSSKVKVIGHRSRSTGAKNRYGAFSISEFKFPSPFWVGDNHTLTTNSLNKYAEFPSDGFRWIVHVQWNCIL